MNTKIRLIRKDIILNDKHTKTYEQIKLEYELSKIGEFNEKDKHYTDNIKFQNCLTFLYATLLIIAFYSIWG